MALSGLADAERDQHGSPAATIPSTAVDLLRLLRAPGAGARPAITRAPRLHPQYWGGMLDFGATTFWEDFDLAWTKNAGRIDELVSAGKKDLHADFGDHCYIGLRHSLCHGWAGGPTAWLTEHVLGIRPLEPGFARCSCSLTSAISSSRAASFQRPTA